MNTVGNRADVIVAAVLLDHHCSFGGFALEDGSEQHARAVVLGLPPQGLAELQVRGVGTEVLSAC